MTEVRPEIVNILTLEECMYLSENGYSFVISDGKLIMIQEEKYYV